MEPGHRVGNLVDVQTVEHGPAAVQVDEEILETAEECSSSGRTDDQDQDRHWSVQ
jgi:hypothetical protein